MARHERQAGAGGGIVTMEIYRSLTELPRNFGPSAVTVGKFDGVHVGHQRMIERLLEGARLHGATPVVLTFDRNPLSVLAPDSCPLDLVSSRQKLELLEQRGVAVTVVVTFDRALSELSPREFVESALVNALHASVVLVGDDFRFGRFGAGNVDTLNELGAELGFDVERIGSVESEGRRASSSGVRELLLEGDVAGAGLILGRHPVVRGEVVSGARRGRELGFPTANLSRDSEGFIPADGVYAAWALVDGRRLPAAVSIGNNPTFEGVPERQVEAHLLGPEFEAIDLDVYGTQLTLEFVDRVRSMAKFSGVDDLIAGITEDVNRVRSILARTAEATG